MEAVDFALIFPLIIIPVLAFIFITIAKKAGYSAWWVVTLLIPFVGIILLWVFAFSDWPAEKT